MRKKLLISILIFVIASVVGTTSTCAFFLLTNSSRFNVELASMDILVMQTGNAGPIVDATGDTTYEKGIKVKNLSTIPVFVRVAISEEWKKDQDSLPSNNVSYTYGSVINEPDTYIGTKEWYKSSDNYYYRRVELGPMQESGDIITDFTIKNSSSIYSNSTLNLNIAAETCQTKNALWQKVFDTEDNTLPIPVGDSWNNQVTEPVYADTSGANAPELASNMIPVKWNGSNWIKADSDNVEGAYSWYNYGNKIWANAVTVRSNILDTYKDATLGTVINMNDIVSFFVWIPRYKYAISTGAGPRDINVIFENKNATKSTGTAVGTDYRTHPGFTFGSNELNGIWIGKFETAGATGSIKIKPNMPSLRNQTISEQFYEARNMQTMYNINGFSQTGINTHMMKSVENGAVSYLTQSEYGKNDEVWINPANNYYTGCAGNSASSSATSGCLNAYDTTNGMQASTTGNIYGIYDLSGGANENLMAVYNKTLSSSAFDSGFFSDTLNDKYYDLYTTTNSNTACNGICYGQALSETSGWYSDYATFVDSTNPWNRIGGAYSNTTNSGIFAYNSNTGSASTDATFRVVAANVNSTDNESPTVVFGTNGNDTYAKNRSTTVTVSDSDSGVNVSSLKYQWTTSAIAPSEGSFNAHFASGQSINSPVGVTGSYYLWILAKDTSENTTIIRSNVFNLDNIIPVITMLGSSPITLNVGDAYSDAGATASDNIDGNLTGRIQVTGTVNPNVVGSYTVTYNVSDNSGNAATSVVRTINVIDNVAPSVAFGTNGDGTYAKSRSTTVTVSDSGSGVNTSSLKYQWTTSTTAPTEGSFSSSFTNGNTVSTPAGVTGGYYLWILAKDISNNTTILGSSVFNLDNTVPTAPTVNFNGYTPGTWSLTNITIDLNATDSNSGIKEYLYSIDDGATWHQVNQHYAISSDAVNYISYKSVDNANNESATTNTYAVGRDATPPTTPTVNFNGYIPGTWTKQNVTFDLSSTDNLSGLQLFQFSSDNGQTWNYVDPTFTVNWDAIITCIFRSADWAGNFSSPTIAYTIKRETTPPVITMNGSSPITINIGDAYTDAGATASDNVDGNITGNIQVTSTVNPNVIGNYTVTYNVSDTAGNAAIPVVRTVNVIDNIAPSVAFGTNGNSTYAKSRNTTVTVSDNVSVNTSSLKYQWTTSTSAPTEVSFSTTFTNGETINTTAGVTGSYYLWILAKDNASNTTITRSNVFNLDNTLPVITMSGSTPVTITQGDVYNDLGATASDNIDGNITGNIQVTSTVNPSIAGTYTVTYNVSDTVGNAATPVVRTVNVQAPAYADNSGANAPELSAGMIPVKWNGTNWIKADNNNLVGANYWYDYSNQMWANAVTVTSGTRTTYQSAAVGTTINTNDINTYFVWVPRFSYKIPSGSGAREILIHFEAKNATKSTGDAVNTYYTHPAFTFGTTELGGIWVGKFETTGTITSPTILPDITSIRNQPVKAMYDSVKTYMQGSSTYGFTSNEDVHMSNNMEWGAAAYLSESTYGKYGNSNYSGANKEIYINDSSGYITGRSSGAPGGAGVLTPTYEYSAAGYYTYDGKCATIHANLPAPCNSGSTGQTLSDKNLSYGASSTGTIYGVYDMSGGSWEFTMAIYKPSPLTGIKDCSGYSSSYAPPITCPSTGPYDSQYDNLTINSKYYNVYANSSLNSSGILGDATKETSAWYSDNAYNYALNQTWMVRNGNYGAGTGAGPFSFNSTAGSASGVSSFRVIVAVTGVVVDTTAPSVAFGTNGNSTYAESRSTTVTVSDSESGVNTSSLKYQWTTSTTVPTEGSFSTTFTNGGTISSPAGVTGGYYLWILAKDNSSNTTIVRSNIFNLDNTIPVITMLGSTPVTINVGDTYSDAGATASDNVDGNITGNIQVTSTVNPNVPGSYTVTYNVSDTAGNAAIPVVRTINVIDNVAPSVAFGTNGNTTYAKSRSTTVTVSDNVSVNTSSLKYQWTTSTSAPTEVSFSTAFNNGDAINTPAGVTGSYYLWILAKDNASTPNTAITRSNVFNLDNTIPVITMLGSTPVNISQGDTYSDAGATATDNIDGSITGNIQATSTVNPSVVGTYTVTYTVSDAAGNAATPVVRTVNVNEKISGPGYIASKGVNGPVLATGMVPIKWDGSAWADTTISDSSWYDYTSKNWANARTADGSMWVWIPRYIYKIPTANWHTNTAGTINIQFTKNVNDNWNSGVIGNINAGTGSSTSNNTWTNEPAFTFGSTELTGIWVAKFEASGTLAAIDIKPSVASINSQTIGNIFTATRNMGTNARYGWGTSGAGIDTHLIKNVEWGAATYLSQSVYGKNAEVWTNPSSSGITGCAGTSVSASSSSGCSYYYNTSNGQQASTTGNIYGIYDMSGGLYDYVAGYVNNSNASTNGGSITSAAAQYKDVYAMGSPDNDVNNYTNVGTNKKGDALYETSSGYSGSVGWYSDGTTMAYTLYPWFVRGGKYGDTSSAGLYAFVANGGQAAGAMSFRPVVIVLPSDTTPPIITMNGSSPVTINVGDTYSDAGATASDNVDGNITGSIQTTSTVNPSIQGSYTVTYNVSDSAGNAATPVVRTVNVVPAFTDYIASEGVNKPKLTTGMTAIKWNSGTSTWDTVSNPDTDTSWYDYSNKQWANAKTADGSFWVWIPRYAYQVSSGYHTNTASGIINVKFLEDNSNTASDSSTVATTPTYSGSNQTNYVLQPAFTFGGVQITGIWVAKFEPSVSNQSDPCYTSSSGPNCDITTLVPKVIPNAVSWRNQTISTAFTVSRNMENAGNPYGWSGSAVDTHLEKNTEWGAVSYLSYSPYGKTGRIWINPNSNYITGCAGDSLGAASTTACNSYETANGVNASTTGNIYGIYDIAGGAWERPAAYINNGNSDIITSGASLANANARYKNVYTMGSGDTAQANYDANAAIIGDAIYETSSTPLNYTAWNDELTSMPYGSTPWFYRGCDNTYSSTAGPFTFRYVAGAYSDNRTFRPVVIVAQIDDTLPVITMNGSSPVTIHVGDTYSDAGATASDNVDGNITGSIQATSTVNPSVAGTYTVTYNVSDSAGNAATPVVRTVNVVEDISGPNYITSKGVNGPVLATGMVPIKWNGTTWVDTTVYDPNWYSYDTTNKQWANARTAEGSMWVWIPRYIYKITSGWHSGTTGAISIQFTQGTNDNWNSGVIGSINTDTTANGSNNTWTNHPAFTFGGTELTGIWVAKFEATAAEGVQSSYTGCNLNDNVSTKTAKILPNMTAWTCINNSNAFLASRNMETKSTYGWGTSGTGIDTHLMKNIEWGAVAYLTKSVYGKDTVEVWINNAKSLTTGCGASTVSGSQVTTCANTYETTNGVKASTTGNIYGIYDMRGGVDEQTAAYLNNNNANLTTYSSSLLSADPKYIDVYTVAGTDSATNNYPLAISHKGDAIYETSGNGTTTNGAWFSDYSLFTYTTTPSFYRGGNSNETTTAGLFDFKTSSGNNTNGVNGFRPVLVAGAGL